IKGTFTSVAVKAPAFGDRRKAMLEDISILTGGQVVAAEVGLKLDQVGLEVLGRARRIVVTKDNTTIVGAQGAESAVKARIGQLEAQLERAKIEHDQDSLELRIARMNSSVAVINVGGATSVELKDRMLRVEDSLAAARAALSEGVVPGGGAALVHARKAAENLDLAGDEGVGRDVVVTALSEPVRWIAINAGYDGDQVVATLLTLSPDDGFNALTGEFGRMDNFQVMDPLQVTRATLESAASIAALLITTETAIVEEVEGNPGSINAPGFGDLAEGLVRPSNIY
ncbi:MAG: chaperonin GroEL, partial [Propionibacteriales bacterium]|nr:chaperonin GroEL [Propionibacteriales bacterium]